MINTNTTITITGCSSGDWVILSINGDEYNLSLQLKRKFEG